MNFSAQKGILAGLAAYDYLRSLSRPKESSQMTSEEFITKTMSANGVLIMDLSCKTAARSPATSNDSNQQPRSSKWLFAPRR